jgi:aminoglycoside/choline kinase family phosphotransferase
MTHARLPDDGDTSEIEPQLRSDLKALVADTLGGCEIENIEAVPAGLGARRFFRLRLGAPAARSAIARVEAPEDDSLRPPGVPPEPALEPLRSFLEQSDIPVPACLGRSPERGIELLEDLGDESLEVLATRASEPERRRLYSQACSVAARLQQLHASPDRVPAFARRLDAALFRYKAEQLIEWALPWSHGRPTTAGEAAVVREAFELVAREAAAAPARLAHRDYKAANLFPRGSELVLIDLQGALMAPPEYDFVCLLRDSHVPLPNELVAELAEAVRPLLPDAPSHEEFWRRFTLLTLTRVGKDLSRYLYAARERSDDRYLRLLPEASRNLLDAAQRSAAWHPALARLAELLADLPQGSARGR